MQAMPIYTMSVHLLPKDTCNQIDKIMRDFWWGDSIEKKKIHTIAWEKICQTRSNEGLGIRKIETFNKALVAKQFWRTGQNPQLLLAKTLKSKYYPKTNHIWEIDQVPRNSSKMWKNIWQTKNSSLAQAKWQVGKEDSIRLRDSFWYKPRNGDSLDHLQLWYGTIKDLMDPTSWNWNSELINTVYNRPEAEAILSTTFPKFGNIDKVIWPFFNSGEYQVKQDYKMLMAINQENSNRNDHTRKKCWLNFWKLGIPFRVFTFLWKILHCGLPTRTELAKK